VQDMGVFMRRPTTIYGTAGNGKKRCSYAQLAMKQRGNRAMFHRVADSPGK